MTRIFVYEYLTGGGIDPQCAPPGSLADLSTLVVEGRAMRDALVADLAALDGVAVTFASSRFERFEPAGDAARAAHRSAEPGESMTAFVARVAREHDYAWIVAPECDGLLLRMHDAAGAARWLGCTREAVRVASSKRATAACLAVHGIETTAALEPGSDAPGDAACWVVKPDDGAGSLDTWVFDAYADACAEYDARAAAGRSPVLQGWVDGEPLSLSLICADGRAELVSINRQQIAICERDAPGPRTRIVEFDGVEPNQVPLDGVEGRALAALAQRVADALPGLRGFVGIDVVRHPRRGPVVIEVNPRVTAAYAGLSAALEQNVARRVLGALGVALGPVEAVPVADAAGVAGAASAATGATGPADGAAPRACGAGS